MTRGDVWWVDLGLPCGSEPGFRRPVLIVQNDGFSGSSLATVLVVPITSNLMWADAPGNVLLSRKESGLPRESVVNVSQLTVMDKGRFEQRVRRLPPVLMKAVELGLRLVLDLA
ncbi:MAG: type II toxin-antitoxin system PemK/MazF family toxin [Leptospiraceae bacterium]|nr:type II toxin-antitoxin system PemK/MazF family toxin [Leptospiraceae bacterium]